MVCNIFLDGGLGLRGYKRLVGTRKTEWCLRYMIYSISGIGGFDLLTPRDGWMDGRNDHSTEQYIREGGDGRIIGWMMDGRVGAIEYKQAVAARTDCSFKCNLRFV